MHRRNIKSKKRGITPVVATALLLVVAVLAVVGFGKWFNSYESKVLTGIEGSSQADLGTIQIQMITPQYLYVLNSNNFPVNFTDIKVNDVDCGLSGTLEPNKVNEISLGSCLNGIPQGTVNVALFTTSRIFSSTLLLKGTFSGNLSVVFKNGPCDPGYIRIYGLETPSNSHVQLGNLSDYPYSICLKDTNYNLGRGCSGNYVRLFYIDNASNAHAYTDNSSPYGPVDTWYQVCVNSSGGTLNAVVSSTKPGLDYYCVGSFDGINNTIGSHMGNCDAYADKVWLEIK